MRKVIFSTGEFYHLYNRGVDKRTTFTSQAEYQRFLAYLYLLNTKDSVRAADLFTGKSFKEVLDMERGEPLVAIGAYCLMPNHFHIYATPLVDGGVSKFMQRLQTAYTMYFNEKHKRSGSLFQGTFKAEHVEKDQYAKYLLSYIHLNPAKIKDKSWKTFGVQDFKEVREFVRNYPYSSIGEYISGSHLITNPAPFPRYFSTAKDIDAHIDFWLSSETP